jgi:4-diphosphocytidyl-2-C-methyl-D-erythritol kinase
MVSFPPCKINLGLNILSKRPDGYHNLETCFYPIPWTDILEVIPADRFAFTQTGHPVPGKEADNLCIKAYELLRDKHHLPPAKIHLHKILPMGAGLGGGSSDAAHTLRLLNTVFHLQLSPAQLAGYAAQLGSDCAFFTQDQPMLGEGRGEVLSPTSVTLQKKFVVLVKPDIHVSTAEAYAGITPRQPEQSLGTLLNRYPLEAWRERIKNDFEETVFKKHPTLQSVKEKLYASGALYASMSGSGATLFGIFDKPINIQTSFPDMTVWSGGI